MASTKMPLKEKILIIVCVVALLLIVSYLSWVINDPNAYKIPENVSIGLLLALCLTVFVTFIVKVIKSVKHESRTKVWRKTIKNGDVINFYTGPNGADYVGSVISDNGEKCLIQIEVSKDKLYENDNTPK
jgi:hypothetical protein